METQADVEITASPPAKFRQTLTPQPQYFVRLSAGRNLHGSRPFERWHFETRTEYRIRNLKGLNPPQISTATLEAGIRPGVYHHEEIPRHPAGHRTWHAMSRHPQSHPLFYTHRDLDGKRLDTL
jgi:hypothetical protein